MNFAKVVFFTIVLMGTICYSQTTDNKAPEKNASLNLDKILSGIEKKYSGPGFTARFRQISVIKAMDITDTATGKVFVKRPGKMRWEYEKPEKQLIISDGEILWIFRPEDNQVMMGKAPSYFGGGKGASFLSDIKVIRDYFEVKAKKSDNENYYCLELIPKHKTLDLVSVLIYVSKKNFEIEKIITYNAYDDESQIIMENYRFNQNIDDSVFNFQISDDMDVIHLDE